MIISVNWLKKYTDIDLPIDELASLIGERLVEIESVIPLGEKYKDVIIARVIECAPLEGSDHLNVTKLDDGGVVPDVERDENGLVQVVCGAPNVTAGMMVAWLPPKAVVPNTFNDAEPFVLGARALRGVMSNGMIASARELDLYDEHDGILAVDETIEPGQKFVDAYELDDYLLDIENKSLTHRPDAFGLIGFAREVAGIQGKEFITPEWMEVLSGISGAEGDDVPAIRIEDATLSDRFETIVLSGLDETKSSPLQLQTYLSRSGVRPINAAVDVSNYLMLLAGQPSHTYDYDKFLALAGEDKAIVVRKARSDETLTLLDGKEISLDESDIVIAAGNTAIGLAGAMGGANTTVDASTKRVLLEVATFNLYKIRSTQMRHGIFSEAVTRFTKGIPAPLGAPVLARAVELLAEHAGATVSSAVADEYPGKRDSIVIALSEAQVNETLGTELSAGDISAVLENVGFEVSFNDLVASVTVPYWREDIHIPEDVIEEVGRLMGYDTIRLDVPVRPYVATTPAPFDQFRSQLRASLVRTGANEVLTYSFVHGDLLTRAGQKPEESYRITNSISPELQYYRQSLIPSLLTLIRPNVKSGYESFGVFEFNKVHEKSTGLTDESVPVEKDSLAAVFVQSKTSGDAYYQAKQYAQYLFETTGVAVRYELLGDDASSVAAPFEPRRSARIVSIESGETLGVVGEYRAVVQRALKLPAYTAGFEIDLRPFAAIASAQESTYTAPSRYPGTERDVSFQVPTTVTFEQIQATAESVLNDTDLLTTVSPLDIYWPESGDVKNITMRFTLTSYNKTQTNDEIAEVMKNVTDAVIKTTEGKVV